MTMLHVLSSPVADVTGTVTVFDASASTKTEAASNIVRPSDWNSAHRQIVTLSGNTAGQSVVSGTNVVFHGGTNITLGGSTAAGAATIHVIGADQTNQTAGLFAVGNTTQGSSGTQDARSLTFRGAGVASVGISGGSVVVSVPSGGGAGDGYNILAAGGVTADTAATVQFNNANGVSFGIAGSTMTASHNGLTTAALSNHSHNFATTTTNGSNIVVGTANSVGATIGVPAFLTTAQPVGAYLTTARASTDAIGLATAATNVTWTANSAGLSINAAGYAGTGTSATNASITLNSNGLAISVAAPGGGGGAATVNGFQPYAQAIGVGGQVGQNQLYFAPFNVGEVVSHSKFGAYVSYSQATNSTLTVSVTMQMGVYTRTGSSWSRATSYSGSMSINGSGTANSSVNSGVRIFTMDADGSFSGDVGICLRSSTATAGANATLGNMIASRAASNFSGILGVGSAASAQSVPGAGIFSATSSDLPSSAAFSQINMQTSINARPPMFFLTNSLW